MRSELGGSYMVRAILTVTLVSLSLAACGGDDATTTASPTEAPATTTTTTEAAGGVVAVDAAPCGLLTDDDVSEASGLAAAEGREEGPVTCLYDVGTDSGVAIFVAIEDGQGRFSGAASLYSAYVDEGGEMVAGVGESAVYASGFRTIAVDAGGGKFIAVGVNGGYSELDEPRDVLIDLATRALANL